MLVRALRKMGYRAVYTAEPSRGKIGRFIRRYCLHGAKRVPVVVEALLFAADRYEHLENEILPALERGEIVVSDRYLYSSLAYQGASGLSLDWVKCINRHAIKPDLAVYLDVEPEIVIGRLKPKRSVMENLETQRRVQEVYMRLVAEGELVKVDGRPSKDKIAKEILSLVLKRLKIK
jgi:dTMP kinase